MKFKLLSEEWLPIMFEEKVEGSGQFDPVVHWDDFDFWLDDFVRVHNTEWIKGNKFPDYIRGIDTCGYNAFAIEVNSYNTEVRVYSVASHTGMKEVIR